MLAYENSGCTCFIKKLLKARGRVQVIEFYGDT